MGSLWTVFDKITGQNLELKITNCNLSKTNTRLSCQILGAERAAVHPKSGEATQESPRNRQNTSPWGSLGFHWYYRCFTQYFESISALLYLVNWMNACLHWVVALQLALDEIRVEVARAPGVDLSNSEGPGSDWIRSHYWSSGSLIRAKKENWRIYHMQYAKKTIMMRIGFTWQMKGSQWQGSLLWRSSQCTCY